MQRFTSFIRRPVQRQGANQYLLILLLSFAASVTLTRLFLQLTGYPQLGGGTIHIAHVLWGGLLLFSAALLPLIIANRWAFTVGAFLAGAGVGLFIDEVGKFITQSNDYFYPLAAPIIYAFFLLTVLIYTRVRRPPSRGPRAELYRALDAMEEVLEHDLDEDERADLEQRLRYVAEQDAEPDLARLANDLLQFLSREELKLAEQRSTFTRRLIAAWNQFEIRYVDRRLLRAILIGGLLAVALVSLANTLLVFVLNAPPQVGLISSLLAQVRMGQLSAVTAGWLMLRLALEAAVGMLLLIAAGLFLAGRDERAASLGYIGLLLSLTVINLIVFYFDQFSTIITATVQFFLLLLIAYYRSEFLQPPPVPLQTLPAPVDELTASEIEADRPS